MQSPAVYSIWVVSLAGCNKIVPAALAICFSPYEAYKAALQLAGARTLRFEETEADDEVAVQYKDMRVGCQYEAKIKESVYEDIATNQQLPDHAACTCMCLLLINGYNTSKPVTMTTMLMENDDQDKYQEPPYGL